MESAISGIVDWFFPNGIDAAEAFLLIVGLVAQAMFSARFLVQWLVSEKRRESVIPLAFWYLSLCGGVMLFCYAVMRKDPVIMLGQGTGIFIYSRNLWLIYRKRRDDAAQAAPPTTPSAA
ncbi:MAG: lipid-A-disaccharide synthase N-terminal domain-containing protein [Alphaproteobacteria bacterium]|jgi:lipid-A-disaccharide synthase-like uncharacterized protein|nr:lipid-A-disaccharide synthase N-terminal domain-containing protein [Alphaproteobacteria bacterium]